MKSFQRVLASVLLFCAVLSAAAQPAPGSDRFKPVQPPVREGYLHPFSGLFSNLGDSLWGTNLIFHGLAIGSTVLFVKTDWDRASQDYFIRENPTGQTFADIQLWQGNVFTVSAASALYLGGHLADSSETVAAGAAGLQAIGLVGAITGSLKFLSGRTRPGMENSADDFKFDPGGWHILTQRQSWPSGHTSSTIAFFSSMCAFYPDKTWLWFVNGFATSAMAVGMVDGDYHWTSEVVAGALIGFAVGYITGRNFRRMYFRGSDRYSSQNEEPEKLGVAVMPYMRNDSQGLSVTVMY